MKIEVKKEREEKRILVKAPYEENFIREIKRIKGDWRSGMGLWAVPEDNEDEVYDILKSIFGYDKLNPVELTIHVSAEYFKRKYKCTLYNVDLARVSNYSDNVLFDDDTFVAKGKAYTDDQGFLQFEEGTILETKVPYGFLDFLSEEDKKHIEIIKNEMDKEKLISRKLDLEYELLIIESKLKKLEEEGK